MTNEEVKSHMDMLIAHKDKALKTHLCINGSTNGDVIGKHYIVDKVHALLEKEGESEETK